MGQGSISGIERVVRLAKQGEIEESEVAFREYVEETSDFDSDDIRAWIDYVAVLIRNGDYDRGTKFALGFVERVAERLKPDAREAMVTRMFESLTEGTRQLRRQSDAPTGDAGDIATVIDRIERAVEHAPENPQASALLVNGYMTADAWDRARTAVEEGLDRYPAETSLWLLRADIEAHDRNVETVADAYETALDHLTDRATRASASLCSGVTGSSMNIGSCGSTAWASLRAIAFVVRP